MFQWNNYNLNAKFYNANNYTFNGNIFFWNSIATVPLRTKTPTQHHKTAATMTKQNKNTEIKQGGEERRIKHEKIESL